MKLQSGLVSGFANKFGPSLLDNPPSAAPSQQGNMPKCLRLVVAGGNKVGKTAIIEQAIYGNHSPGKPTFPTIEDIYEVVLETGQTDRGGKEKFRIYDTAGLDASNGEISKHHLNIADGFLLVYSVTSKRSFQQIQTVKKEIDKIKGRDFPIVVLGTKTDIKEEIECDSKFTKKWAEQEKVFFNELSVGEKKSLQEPFNWLATRVATCSGKSYLQSGHSEVKRFLSIRKSSKSMSVSKDSNLDTLRD